MYCKAAVKESLAGICVLRQKAINLFVFFVFISCFLSREIFMHNIVKSRPAQIFRLAGARKVLYLNLIFIYVIISLLNF